MEKPGTGVATHHRTIDEILADMEQRLYLKGGSVKIPNDFAIHLS